MRNSWNDARLGRTLRTLRTLRAVRGVALASCCLLPGCGDDDDAPTVDSTPTRFDVAAPDVADVPEPVAINGCADLTSAGVHDPQDAALVPVLCPDSPLDPVLARATLMAVGTAAEAHRAIAQLEDHPEFAALAKLVASVPESLPAKPWTLESAQTAIVTPVDDRVLAQTQIARAMLYDAEVGVDDRTRARAYLAKVHTYAMRQLGIGPLTGEEPFSRLLAAMALDYGRGFCNAYWRRRVSGLSKLFAEVEFDLVRAALVLEVGPGWGDSASQIHQLDEARRYLNRTDVKRRVAARVEQGGVGAIDPRRLAAPAAHIQRLLRLRFVDLAVARAVHIGSQGDGPGLAPMEELIAAGLKNSDGSEYAQRVASRFEAARKREPRPPERGRGQLDPAADPSYPSADSIADEVTRRLELATTPFGQRHALGRAVLQLRRRPDAIAPWVARLRQWRDADPSPASVRALAIAGALAEEFADGNLDGLALAASLDRLGASSTAAGDKDGAMRREFASVARLAGAAPR